MDSQANALYEFLARLDSQDIAIRRQAHLAAKEGLTGNMVAYMLRLLVYCRDAQNQPKEPRVRAMTLLLDTVALDPMAGDFDLSIREQLQSRWRAAPQEDRHEAKFELLSTLAAKERPVRVIAGRLIATIATFDLPENAWPELVQTLSRAADTEIGTNFEAAIMTLSFIAQELPHSPGMAQALLGSTNIFLNAACKGISHPNNPLLQSFAVNTIFHSFELLGGHMAELAQRDYLVGVLCTAAGSCPSSTSSCSSPAEDSDVHLMMSLFGSSSSSSASSPPLSTPTLATLLVKELAMRCLVKLAYLFYDKLGRYKLDLVRITREVIAQRVDADRRSEHDADMSREVAAFALTISATGGKSGGVAVPLNEAAAHQACIDAANRVCLEALQFWATVCIAEKEIREGLSGGRGSLDFSGIALRPLGIPGPMLGGSYGSGGLSNTGSSSSSLTSGSFANAELDGSDNHNSSDRPTVTPSLTSCRKAVEDDRSKTLTDFLLQALLLQPETMAITEGERHAASANASNPAAGPAGGERQLTSASGAKIAAAASKTLLMLAQATGDRIVDKVMPFVQTRVEFKDWRSQEAACMAFGCIVYGPDPVTFREKVSSMVEPLLDLIRSINPIISDTAAWSIALVCDQFADVFLSVEGSMDSLLNAVNAMFRRGTGIALRAAQIIQNLALQFEDEDDPDGKRRRGDDSGDAVGDVFGGTVAPLMGGASSGDYSSQWRAAGGIGEARWKDSHLLLVNYGLFVDLLRTSIDQEGGALRMESQEALNALIGAAAPEEKILLILEELLVEFVRKAEEFLVLVRQDSYPRLEGDTFISLLCDGISRMIRKLGRWRPAVLSKHCGKTIDLVLLLLDGTTTTAPGYSSTSPTRPPPPLTTTTGGPTPTPDASVLIRGSPSSPASVLIRGGSKGSTTVTPSVESAGGSSSSLISIRVEALQLFGSLGGAIGRELLDNVALSGPIRSVNQGAGHGRLQNQLGQLFAIIDSALKRGVCKSAHPRDRDCDGGSSRGGEDPEEQLCIAAVAALSDIIPGAGPSFASSELCVPTIQNFESLLKSGKVSIDIKCAVLGCLGELCQYTGGQIRGAVSSLMDLVLLGVEEKEARPLQRAGGMKISDSSSPGGGGGGGVGSSHQYPIDINNNGLSLQQRSKKQAQIKTTQAEAAAGDHNRKLMQKAYSLEQQQHSATANLHQACDLHESICHFLIGIFQGFKGNLDPLEGYVTRSIKLAAKIARDYTTLTGTAAGQGGRGAWQGVAGSQRNGDRYAEEVIRSSVTLLGFIANAVGQEDMNRLLRWRQDLLQEAATEGTNRGNGAGTRGVLGLVADSLSYGGSEAVQEAVRFARDEIDHVLAL